ncbi:hypothetical protein [Fictibacillus sp. 26RED30]|uniref:hypothetical protein n=1 Tax=Fictibacillus sp. 26RED30 TaxID=2745877 RepID=UPI0018CF6B96|nr:hypothetical protein [Fictibacillus sp. 26RED30]MBH0162080.1 hypothetical protein [Fictibacillus sp. 26RED30]
MKDNQKLEILFEIITDLTTFVEQNKDEIKALDLETLKTRNKQVIDEARKLLSKRRFDV